MNFLTGAALLLGLAQLAAASPITYAEQTTASGTIGTNSFTNALLTLTFTGNTTNVVPDGTGFFQIDATGTMLTIAGIGSGTVTAAGIDVFVNQTFAPPAAGFGAGAGSILDTFSSAFATYALTTAIGPVSGTNFINSGTNFATSLGNLDIVSAGNSTFTASTSTAPEPMTTLLAGFGLAVVVRYGRSVRRSKVQAD